MGLVIDNANLEKLLRGPSGPVHRDTIRRVERYQLAVRRTLSNHSKTGCLEKSVLKRILPDGTIIVISDTAPCSPDHKSYSLFVHEGTKAHIITPKKAKVLAFKIGGNLVFSMEVKHPGTKPIRFLTDNFLALR